jgi:hypothetical protein
MVSIYPNPAKETIHVEFTADYQVEHISLHTADGREVPILQTCLQSSGMMIKIPQISPGLHVLRILLKNGCLITRKIVVW